MTADANWLADLHAACFTTPRPWAADEFARLLADETTVLALDRKGFALGRAIAGEGEILTLAVDPQARRQGIGRLLLSELEARFAERSARRIFLEVSTANTAAIALYQGAGYGETGRRRGYYRTADAAPADALILSKDLAAPA